MIQQDEAQYALLFEGLKVLSESSFPKRCGHCGTVYQSADEFISKTAEINGHSGLKASRDDDESTLIELYRNCHCGSTLMEFFSERRDASGRGLQRRKKFSQLVLMLNKKGVATDDARHELKCWMRGEPCPKLKTLGFA
ncbi:MAG: oxidoreductase [Motiliproteus sp.]